MSNNNNPNNFKNKEPTYVTIRNIKSFQIIFFEIMHVHWFVATLKNKKCGMWTN